MVDLTFTSTNAPGKCVLLRTKGGKVRPVGAAPGGDIKVKPRGPGFYNYTGQDTPLIG